MSSRRSILANNRFLLFLYIVIFSTVSLWITYFYGFSFKVTDRPPSPIDQSRNLEIRNLKARLKHYESLFEKSFLPKGETVQDLPFIYAITPTFTRPVQKAELVRLSLAFLHVKNFHWIVVEDSQEKTTLVSDFLQNCGLMFTHLNVKTNENYQLKSTDPNWKLPRGVDQRNAGIEWLLRSNKKKFKPGVVYFADDDNTYSLQLFQEMRYTKKVSVWPVGLVGGMRFERPIVSSSGKVTGWYTMWDPRRPFAMDMAGFAVNLSLLMDNPEAKFDIKSRRGHVESSLLSSLGVTMSDLEPKADNCTKVYVWHTRTEKPNWKQEVKLIAAGRPSDPKIEV